MRILLWHVHGGWTDAFVRGGHDYVLPASPEGGRWGLGRGGRPWPATVTEAGLDALADQDVDVVVLQSPEEIPLVERLLGRRPGADLPAVFVEHNLPRADVPGTRHPIADRDDITLVHVTPFNALVWDNGDAPVRVIEHGVRDPGPLYSGSLPRLAAVANEPVRRARVLGTDLLPRFAAVAPIDLFGMKADGVAEFTGLPPERLRAVGDIAPYGPDGLAQRLARRRAYLHPVRWTSLGLSLIEAMLIGMPVLVLAAGQAAVSVPDAAGAVSLDLSDLAARARRFIDDPDAARRAGAIAREAALERFALARFLADWDEVLSDVTTRRPRTTAEAGHSRKELAL